MRDGVEALRRRHGRGLGERGAPHPVDPERAQVVAQVVVGGEVPAARVDDETVRAELALRLVAGERAVADLTRRRRRIASASSRTAAASAGAAPRRRGEAERLLERLDLAAERRREDAVDLRERAVDGVRRAVRRRAARREQPEHDRDRLLVAEHQRRQPVARADPVAAADAALSLDRDPELLQDADVAPRRARVDPEPVGDLAAGRQRPRLQQLEQLEQARGR